MPRFEPFGDDPSAVERQAQAWRRVSQRMGAVARDVDGQVRTLVAAWPEGGAGDLALVDAQRCATAAAEAAGVHGRAAALLTDLVEPLARWRRRVSELEEAWLVLSRAEDRLLRAVRHDLGDRRSQARITAAEHHLLTVRARTGHPDAASVEAVYRRLRGVAAAKIEAAGRQLSRLTAQGSAPVAGAGAGGGAVSRFRTELGRYATGVRAQGRLAPQVARLVESGVLPREALGWDATAFAGYVQRHPEVATRLVEQRPVAGADTEAFVDPIVVTGAGRGSAAAPLVAVETFLASLGPAPKPTLTSAGDPGWPRRLAVRDAFEVLTPSEQQLTALLWPSTVGHLSGAPFSARSTANHVRVLAALAREGSDAAVLDKSLRDTSASPGVLPGSQRLWGELDKNRRQLAELRTLAADPSRQVLAFDYDGDGSVVELHGALTRQTVGVGVFVPGTTAELGGHEANVDRSMSWVRESNGRVAMVTWMGGDLPDTVAVDAPFRDYADRLAPELAAFSHDLRQEIDRSPTAHHLVRPGHDRPGPAVTVIGHSYGGAVVGTSEMYGLDADNIIHVESAGAGHDVDGIEDYRQARCDVTRYTITASNDPIRLIQNPVQPLPNLGHGAGPAELGRVVRLDGELGSDRQVLRPWNAHGGVLDEGAEGWNSIRDVLSGQR